MPAAVSSPVVSTAAPKKGRMIDDRLNVTVGSWKRRAWLAASLWRALGRSSARQRLAAKRPRSLLLVLVLFRQLDGVAVLEAVAALGDEQVQLPGLLALSGLLPQLQLFLRVIFFLDDDFFEHEGRLLVVRGDFADLHPVL